MDRNRVQKTRGQSRGRRERRTSAASTTATATARLCPLCCQLWAACDCDRSHGRERSQSTPRGSPASLSSTGTATTTSRITTPGDLSLARGVLEPLPAEITTAFFDFVGDSPSPITDVFSMSFMRTYLETSLPVRAIVTTIGKIKLKYAAKNADLEIVQAAATKVMNEDRPKLTEYLDVLTSPESGDQHLILLFGLLLAYAECMVGVSWLLFQSIMRKLSVKVKEKIKKSSRIPLLYFDRGLLMNFSMFMGYYALVSYEDTFLADVELYDPSVFANIDAQNSPIRTNAAVFHHYCKYVAYFSRLHYRTTKWVRQARQLIEQRQTEGFASEDDLKQVLVEAGLLHTGEQLIKSSVQVSDTMNLLKGETEDDKDVEKGDFSTLREAFYHLALLGLTRSFWDPTWKLVSKDLPHMEDMQDLEAHSVAVLEVLEKRAPLLGLESWTYLIILMAVALEVHKSEYRERVAALVTDIRGKGFAIAEAYLADMRLIWGMDYATQHYEGVGPSPSS